MRLLLLGFLLFIFSCKSPRSVKEMNSKESPPPSLDIICQVQNSNGKTFSEVLTSYQQELKINNDKQLYDYIQNKLMRDRESWLHKEFLTDQKFMDAWVEKAKLLNEVKEEEAVNWLKNLQNENPPCFQLMMLSMNILSPTKEDK